MKRCILNPNLCGPGIQGDAGEVGPLLCSIQPRPFPPAGVASSSVAAVPALASLPPRTSSASCLWRLSPGQAKRFSSATRTAGGPGEAGSSSLRPQATQGREASRGLALSHS